MLEPRASGRPDAGALQVRRLLFDNRHPTILHSRPRRGAALRRRTGDVKKGATFHSVAPFHGGNASSNFAGDAIKNDNYERLAAKLRFVIDSCLTNVAVNVAANGYRLICPGLLFIVIETGSIFRKMESST